MYQRLPSIHLSVQIPECVLVNTGGSIGMIYRQVVYHCSPDNGMMSETVDIVAMMLIEYVMPSRNSYCLLVFILISTVAPLPIPLKGHYFSN